jgi:hypothetical protein
MQYVLTQEEYDALRARQEHEIKLSRAKLQKLCTKIADTMPVKRDWNPDGEPAPWGCVLTEKYEHYCDHCPVQEICPYDDKEWSK